MQKAYSIFIDILQPPMSNYEKHLKVHPRHGGSIVGCLREVQRLLLLQLYSFFEYLLNHQYRQTSKYSPHAQSI